MASFVIFISFHSFFDQRTRNLHPLMDALPPPCLKCGRRRVIRPVLRLNRTIDDLGVETLEKPV